MAERSLHSFVGPGGWIHVLMLSDKAFGRAEEFLKIP
jgi:hypothetical protein